MGTSKGQKAVRIAFFNHKGGVGKTTLTFNVAAALASLGKNILLVDSDPQCNLSSYIIEDHVLDDLLDHSDTQKGKTIWSALKPLAEGTGGIRVVRPFERMENLHILPGDIQLSLFEQELTHFWGECFQRKARGLNGTTALSSLVSAVVQKLDINFVFYDSGPNIGPLNRVILLDCDYFIIPAACDLFSIRALKTLGQTLKHWIQDWETIYNLAPDPSSLFKGRPKLLGYIPQKFRIYGGQITTGYSQYLSKLEKHIHDDVIAVLRKIDPSLAKPSASQNKLGQVRDFSSLASKSQNLGVPIHEVTSGPANLISDAEKSFMAIAKKIVNRTREK